MSQGVVKIRLEGGIIQEIVLPEGVTAIVRDYDVEGADVSDISLDDEGQECIATVWGEPELLEIKPNGGGISDDMVAELVAWTETADQELESIMVALDEDCAEPDNWSAAQHLVDGVEWRTT